MHILPSCFQHLEKTAYSKSLRQAVMQWVHIGSIIDVHHNHRQSTTRDINRCSLRRRYSVCLGSVMINNWSSPGTALCSCFHYTIFINIHVLCKIISQRIGSGIHSSPLQISKPEDTVVSYTKWSEVYILPMHIFSMS